MVLNNLKLFKIYIYIGRAFDSGVSLAVIVPSTGLLWYIRKQLSNKNKKEATKQPRNQLIYSITTRLGAG
jgi:hypothetical protein